MCVTHAQCVDETTDTRIIPSNVVINVLPEPPLHLLLYIRIVCAVTVFLHLVSNLIPNLAGIESGIKKIYKISYQNQIWYQIHTTHTLFPDG
jgi:hypothetical protein